MHSVERQPITVGAAARILRVCEDTMCRLERDGILRAVRTRSGMRIFEQCEVEQLTAQRAQERR
jgi:predicted site-specific integrase-resolvase